MGRRRTDLAQPTLRFRGGPMGLETLVPPALLEAGPVGSVTLKLPGDVARLTPAPLHVAPVGSAAAYLRFSLPETTPPGSYSGTAELGGAEYPVVAEVEPYVSLRVAPTILTFSGAPGDSVNVHVTVLNDGNVVCAIRRAYAFGLFDQEGIEAAFGRGFRDDTAKGDRRFDRFVEALADHHELARLQVVEGAGELQPGEVRALTLSIQLPEELETGHTYQGTWTLYTVGYTVRVAVAGERPTRRRRAG